jgi:hypothetical protein
MRNRRPTASKKLGVLDDKAYAAALVRRYSLRGGGE